MPTWIRMTVAVVVTAMVSMFVLASHPASAQTPPEFTASETWELSGCDTNNPPSRVENTGGVLNEVEYDPNEAITGRACDGGEVVYHTTRSTHEAAKEAHSTAETPCVPFPMVTTELVPDYTAQAPGPYSPQLGRNIMQWDRETFTTREITEMVGC